MARVLLSMLFVVAPLAAKAPPPRESGLARQALERYLREQCDRPPPSAAPTSFQIDAALPKLHKRGVLRGLKVIAGPGRIAFTQLHFVGDSLVKTAVIARFLTVETKLPGGDEATQIAAANYRFSFKGTTDYGRRTAFIFLMEPKRRQVGLFKGELWLDSETARPLREWGELVKSPSGFVNHVYFVRDYTDSNLRRIIVRLHAVFAGPVELTMWLDEPGRAELAYSPGA